MNPNVHQSINEILYSNENPWTSATLNTKNVERNVKSWVHFTEAWEIGNIALFRDADTNGKTIEKQEYDHKRIIMISGGEGRVCVGRACGGLLGYW